MFKKLLVLYVLGLLFFSCSTDIPEGKGKIVIENDMDDVCYIAKVWTRKWGHLSWNLEYNDGDEYYNQRYVNIYPDPGEYSIRVRVYYFDVIPIEAYTMFFTTQTVTESETTWLHFDGISIHE